MKRVNLIRQCLYVLVAVGLALWATGPVMHLLYKYSWSYASGPHALGEVIERYQKFTWMEYVGFWMVFVSIVAYVGIANFSKKKSGTASEAAETSRLPLP